MSRVTQREVYRTLVGAKLAEWRVARDRREDPRMTYTEFAEIIKASELLVDDRSIRQKWEISQAQGIFKPVQRRMCAVDLAMIEVRSGIAIPPLPAHTRECVNVCESCSADARGRARARGEPQEDETITRTVSYEEGSE